MMNDTYKPVSCNMHSELELAIMRGQKIILHSTDNDGEVCREEVTPVDVITRDKAEYLVYIDSEGNKKEKRLDKIAEAAF